MDDHILVATDGSDGARGAVAMAAKLAKAIGAPLTVLHVVPPGFASAANGLPGSGRVFPIGNMIPGMSRPAELSRTPGDGIDESALAFGKTIVEEARNEARRLGVEYVSARLDMGDCAETVLETAREISASLIVVGSRGLGHLKGMLLGSVSKKVAHGAHCSVLIVR
ncbi:universal stress protein (plasmid) [Ensifer adhaerens]|uniref:universal stress protein n=1 Tax=Ensifer adhaerens TaxID=106592 RepID=UPI0023A918DC|nr:universal stress protein [Ensifer adhaerens]WDZ81514.1 universal stress protein [Ensifer adhaerens]